MNTVALCRSMLLDTLTNGTLLSRGKRAGLIQSERTPTRNGEKASPNAWLTRICGNTGNSAAYLRLSGEYIKHFFRNDRKEIEEILKNITKCLAWTADAKLRRLATTIYIVMSLTMDQLQLRRSPAMNVKSRHWFTLCRATRNPAKSTNTGEVQLMLKKLCYGPYGKQHQLYLARLIEVLPRTQWDQHWEWCAE